MYCRKRPSALHIEFEPAVLSPVTVTSNVDSVISPGKPSIVEAPKLDSINGVSNSQPQVTQGAAIMSAATSSTKPILPEISSGANVTPTQSPQGMKSAQNLSPSSEISSIPSLPLALAQSNSEPQTAAELQLIQETELPASNEAPKETPILIDAAAPLQSETKDEISPFVNNLVDLMENRRYPKIRKVITDEFEMGINAIRSQISDDSQSTLSKAYQQRKEMLEWQTKTLINRRIGRYSLDQIQETAKLIDRLVHDSIEDCKRMLEKHEQETKNL